MRTPPSTIRGPLRNHPCLDPGRLLHPSLLLLILLLLLHINRAQRSIRGPDRHVDSPQYGSQRV